MTRKNKFRMVGFTNSTYTDGSPEVGYKGDFCRTISEARRAGCGDNGLAAGYEIREYIRDRFVAAHDCD